MLLNEALTDFRTDITRVNNYVNLAYEQDDTSNNIRSDDEIEFLVTSAFLKLFIAWESFLEKSFIAYLTGEKSLSNDSLIRYANPIDKEHAHKFLIGTQRYFDWADPQMVIKIAEIYFEKAEPYATSLKSIKTDLSDLKTIRNASAHITSTTQKKLDAVASRVLGKPVSNIGVAKFITKISPEDQNKTILQMFQLKLEITAENIAKNLT